MIKIYMRQSLVTRTIFGAIVVFVQFVPYFKTPVSAQSPTVITLDPNTRYQTFQHWEGVDFTKHYYYDPEIPAAGQDQYYKDNTDFPNYIDELLNRNVDLGINRIRLEIRSGSENQNIDWFEEFRSKRLKYRDNSNNPQIDSWREARGEAVNDNADPYTINWNAFRFSEFDSKIDKDVIPFRNKLATQSKKLYINLCVVDFGESAFELRNNPEEYAEFVQAVFEHMKTKYGFVPDSVENLEPNNANWNSAQLGKGIVAVGQRLKSIGYTPDFIAPSLSYLNNAATYFDTMVATSYTNPRTQQTETPLVYLKTFGYHLYNGNDTPLRNQVLTRAKQHNLTTGMVEWWFGNPLTTWKALHDDLKIAQNSVWEHGTFYGMFDVNDDDNVATPTTVTISDKTKYLQHYITYIKSGAQRISATAPGCADGQDDSACTLVNPIAFINTDSTYVVVVRTLSNQLFTIKGLPNGTYGIRYTTSTTSFDQQQADQNITDGQLTTSIPATGVMTVFQKTSSISPSPTPTISISPTGQTVCPHKSKGDADCKANGNEKNIDIADFEIWRKEYFSQCSAANLTALACQTDDDGIGTLMDANFDTDTSVTVADFEIWRKGYFEII